MRISHAPVTHAHIITAVCAAEPNREEREAVEWQVAEHEIAAQPSCPARGFEHSAVLFLQDSHACCSIDKVSDISASEAQTKEPLLSVEARTRVTVPCSAWLQDTH